MDEKNNIDGVLNTENADQGNNLSSSNQQNNETNDVINISNINSGKDENSNSDPLTMDYDNLYKLESDDTQKPKVETSITSDDIHFESEDHIEDQTILEKKENDEAKNNLIFMGIVLVVLILAIIYLFPIVFKLGK